MNTQRYQDEVETLRNTVGKTATTLEAKKAEVLFLKKGIQWHEYLFFSFLFLLLMRQQMQITFLDDDNIYSTNERGWNEWSKCSKGHKHSWKTNLPKPTALTLVPSNSRPTTSRRRVGTGPWTRNWWSWNNSCSSIRRKCSSWSRPKATSFLRSAVHLQQRKICSLRSTSWIPRYVNFALW